MTQKVIKFEYGRAYESEMDKEKNVVISRTENTVLFKPLIGMTGDPMFFRRKVKVIKLRDGKKVEYCKALKRESGLMFANNLVEGYIDPFVEEPEIITTKKSNEEDLPYYSEEQLIALSRAKKSSSTNVSRQYIYKNFGGVKK